MLQDEHLLSVAIQPRSSPDKVAACFELASPDPGSLSAPGEVDASDTHRLAVAGEIFGPPKRAAPGASARQLERGVLIGEFQGYVLD